MSLVSELKKEEAEGKSFFFKSTRKTRLDRPRPLPERKKRQKQRSYYSISTNMVIYLRAELGYMPDKAALVVRRRRGFVLIIF